MGNADQTTPPGGAPFGDESLDEVLKVFFEDDPERDGDSVLEQISRLSGSEPRILLRDDVADDASPVLKALPRSGPGSIENDRRYLVMGEIARGGVGIVYKSRDRDLGRNVALKVLRPDHADNPDVIDRFVEEAQVEGQLQHPNIVPVYGLGMQPDGRPYFVMKLVKGQTLSARMQGREDPTEDRHIYLTAFEQVSRAMAYAHARGVIHRDLKPANVMIGAFGEVQVMDWGFAKVLGREDEPATVEPPPDMTVIATKRSAEDGSQSIAGSVMGTPAYMPPEQALGRVAELDERSDVFSLGAILCEILTGEPPYVGEPADLLVMAAQCRQDEAHERLDASVSAPALIDLVKRCLAPLRADRPENAGAVGREIHEHLAEIAEKARLAEVAAAEEMARQEEQNAHLAREKLRVEKLKARVAEERAESERESEEETKSRRRAQADRRARMGVLALAAVLLLVVLLGGYGWLRHGQEEQERLREVSGEVTAALQLATDHEGRQEWGRALETATTARDLAERADEATRTRADTIFARIEEGKARADAERKRRDRDDAFLARLEASWARRSLRWLEDPSRGPGSGHGAGRGVWLWSEADDTATVELFREYGLDFELLDSKAATERIRTSARAVEIACCLTTWASKRSRAGLESGPLLDVARLADPDPWRNRLRDAMLDGDPTPLIELSESALDAEQPGPPLSLLASALWESKRDRADGLRAIEVTRWAHRRLPDSVLICTQLALRLIEAGNHLEAAHRVHVARATRPEIDWLVVLQAQALASCREFDDAEALCREAMAGSSRPHPNLYFVLAWISEEKGEFPEVVKRWDEYIEHANPVGKAIALHRISGILYRRGRSQEALRRAKEARETDPDSHATHHQRADLYEATGQDELACESFERACESRPTCLNAWLGWTRMLGILGRADRIATVVDTARNLDTGHGMVPFVRGAAREALNDLPGAIEAYREAIEKGSGGARVRSVLVLALVANEQLDEALVEARRAVRLAPTVRNWNMLGGTYSRLGMFDRSLEACREEVYVRPSPRSHANLANAYRLTGKAADAWRELERADGLFRDHWEILTRYAQYHFDRDQPEKTRRIYDRLIERNENTATAHWGRGDARAAMGEFAAAVDDLEKALDLGQRLTSVSFPRFERAMLERKLGEYRAMAECAGRQKTIQNGSEGATSIEETLTFAKLCHYTRHHDSAVRYFRKAFEADPVVAESLDSDNPGQAAASAARAAGRSSAQGAAVLRGQAHEWMASWVALLRKRLQSGVLDDRILVRRHIWVMKGGPGFAAVRGEAIDAMPEAERERWREFWRDLDEFLKDASREGE